MSLSQASWHGYIEQLCAFAQDVGYAKTLVTLLGAILAYKVVYALYLSPLASIPGPLLARLTNKRARFYNVIGAQARKACEEYEKYGDIYVYEPWAISISNPTDIRTVLGSHAFVKADVYKAGDLLGEGVSLGGHFIPGGTEVNINISGANLNKSYWDEPYLFDPTRFLKSDEAKKNVFTFSVGVRVCPGKHLAWVEMLTILANILKGYDLRLPDNYTTCGPNVLSEKGYPKPMDTAYYAFTNPVNPQRDCRVVISRRL
ncbi:hypothetical protein GGI12_004785 [Dipsacomyces acuminosporus]|nr:hypothetical protein GGI12_004785 [Dipsacomyces acuminosporus]